LCAEKTKLHFPVTDLNLLFVWAMRSVWFAIYTNASNSAGENAVFISIDSCYKSNYYFYIGKKIDAYRLNSFLQQNDVTEKTAK